MTSMFWGLRLEPGKRYSTTVDKSFHVSMAALDCSSVKSDNEVLSVMIEDGETNVPFILCNLQRNKLMQSPLDLNFMSGDRITLFCKGNGVIHLSGYIAPEEDDDDDELGQVSEEEDEDGEEVDISDDAVLKRLNREGKLNGISGKRKEKDSTNPQPKRKKLEKLDEDTDDSGDEDDDIPSDDMEDESLGLEEGDDSDEDDDDEEEDESEDEEADEEEDNDEEEVPTKSVQQLKKNKNQAQQSGGPIKQQNTSIKQQNQGKQKKQNGLTSNAQTKKDKKKGDKPATATSKMNISNDKSPTGKKGADVDASPGRKTLDGGVVIKDIKMGNGPVCKSGKMACVYYTGRFKQNNKVFDSATEGSGFKFRVGKGDVIKGWDVGVVGMKVGGKRLITCPPPMAYGQKGSPPTIPPNSTLVFEVELKNIN